MKDYAFVFTFSLVPISLIIFEDNDHLRESLICLFERDVRYNLLGGYGNCNTASDIVRIHKPDVVLMDIDMPGASGVEGVKQVKEVRPQTAVVMYTVFENDDKLFDCLCAGANGYLLKKTSPARLFDAIEEVVEGGAPMSPSIARKVLDSFSQTRQTRQYHLSQREIDVLQLLVKGHSTKIIASMLFLSFETVRTHLKNIYNKLHVNCGKEAIAKVLTERII
ncbi:MAG: response regulator transcription factor [Chitinophagaceae bacterium]|nr:response regulator transcription factor [Chitinophagaceae bacterium]